jgi:hypothetical protein
MNDGVFLVFFIFVFFLCLRRTEKKKKASQSKPRFRPPSPPAQLRAPILLLLLSTRNQHHYTHAHTQKTTTTTTKKQIFSELASLGPVAPSADEASNPTGGQLVTGVFPFRTSDDVIEPHPGLRAYPFLGQVRENGEGGREREEREKPFLSSITWRLVLSPCLFLRLVFPPRSRHR